MTYEGLRLTDGEILQVMELARQHGALVMVHAENEDASELLRSRAEREGRISPVNHARTRPVPVEREATHRALSLAQIANVPLTIVHVSTGKRWTRSCAPEPAAGPSMPRPARSTLTLTAEDLERAGSDDFEGAKYVCSPPPRALKVALVAQQEREDLQAREGGAGGGQDALGEAGQFQRGCGTQAGWEGHRGAAGDRAGQYGRLRGRTGAGHCGD